MECDKVVARGENVVLRKADAKAAQRVVFAPAQRELLQSILKDGWSYPGFVLTDYGAGKNTIASLNWGLR